MKARLLLAVFAALVAPIAAAETVPEPDGYRMEAFKSPVPATLLSAEVLDTAAAHERWESGALFIDVLPQPPRPADLPADRIWIPPKRLSIPGARWLPNVGFGVLSAERRSYLEENLARLTAGDKAAPMVIFCLADCWMSWNAARRAILELGYTNIAWYPEGTDGWAASGHALARVEPEE